MYHKYYVKQTENVSVLHFNARKKYVNDFNYYYYLAK